MKKTDLCEWTSQTLEKSLTAKNIKFGFKKTGIWPFNEHAVLGSMQPSRGFEENQEGYVPSLINESKGEESGGGEECVHGDHEQNEEPAAIGGVNVSTHFYVDVPNPEESNYERGEQHIAIDPGFLEDVQTSNNNNIAHFLSLPELIPAKRRKRQQPLLDFTQSIILTSKDYSKGLEEILAQKEAIATAALKKEGGERGHKGAAQDLERATTNGQRGSGESKG